MGHDDTAAVVVCGRWGDPAAVGEKDFFLVDR